MGYFPCEHNYGDIIKFKYRGVGIVEGKIVGAVINNPDTNIQFADYKVNSLPHQTPIFYNKQVPEYHIIKE